MKKRFALAAFLFCSQLHAKTILIECSAVINVLEISTDGSANRIDYESRPLSIEYKTGESAQQVVQLRDYSMAVSTGCFGFHGNDSNKYDVKSGLSLDIIREKSDGTHEVTSSWFPLSALRSYIGKNDGPSIMDGIPGVSKNMGLMCKWSEDAPADCLEPRQFRNL